MTRKKMKERLNEYKRDVILEEASKVFEAEGFEQLKISDLAETVGVSVGTIYTLFGSKENLFNHYILFQIESAQELFENKLLPIASPKERLYQLIALKFKIFSTKRKALEQSVMNDPTFFFNYSTEVDSPLQHLMKFVEDSVIKPLIQTESRRTSKELVFLIDGITIGVIKHWLSEAYDLNTRVDDTVALILSIIENDL